MKIVSRVVLAILVLALAGMAFIYFVPGYDLYMVRSESMTPNINMGDLIITGPMNGPVNGEVKPGTVVTYEYQNELITHRVKEINGDVIVTQGDATEDPDPWQVTLSDVRGVYQFKIPSVGFITHYVQTKTGWFVTIIIPGTLLVLWLVKDIVKEALSEA
ncbi:signal peptidase I [Chloroflexota bacterium]